MNGSWDSHLLKKSTFSCKTYQIRVKHFNQHGLSSAHHIFCTSLIPAAIAAYTHTTVYLANWAFKSYVKGVKLHVETDPRGYKTVYLILANHNIPMPPWLSVAVV